MDESVQLFSDFFVLNAAFWLLYGFYVTIRVQLFIVKRFELETDLARTKYFRELMPWLKYTPTFIRSPLYIAHLLTFVWGWARNKDNFKEKSEKGKLKGCTTMRSPFCFVLFSMLLFIFASNAEALQCGSITTIIDFSSLTIEVPDGVGIIEDRDEILYDFTDGLYDTLDNGMMIITAFAYAGDSEAGAQDTAIINKRFGADIHLTGDEDSFYLVKFSMNIDIIFDIEGTGPGDTSIYSSSVLSGEEYLHTLHEPYFSYYHDDYGQTVFESSGVRQCATFGFIGYPTELNVRINAGIEVKTPPVATATVPEPAGLILFATGSALFFLTRFFNAAPAIRPTAS